MTGHSAPLSNHQQESDGLESLSVSDTQLLQSMGFWPTKQSGSIDGSPYIVEVGGNRLLHFDHRTIQSSMNLTDPIRLEFDYFKVMMGFLLFNPQPKIIKMVGLGGGALLKYCYYNVPSSMITVVEIDAGVIALRNEFYIPADNYRLRTVLADGADFMQQHGPKADVILVDGFNIDGQPPQLCSREFYEDCYNRLTPDGVFVVNIWEKHRLCIANLRKVFGNKMIVVPTHDGDNRAVFATKRVNRSFIPNYTAVKEVYDDLHAEFLPQVYDRISRQSSIWRKLYNTYDTLTFRAD